MADADRINAKLIPQAKDALDWLAGHKGLSRTDIINRALQLYHFTEQRTAAGDQLALLHADGQLESVRVF